MLQTVKIHTQKGAKSKLVPPLVYVAISFVWHLNHPVRPLLFFLKRCSSIFMLWNYNKHFKMIDKAFTIELLLWNNFLHSLP
jgi:hypothetical protein